MGYEQNKPNQPSGPINQRHVTHLYIEGGYKTMYHATHSVVIKRSSV